MSETNAPLVHDCHRQLSTGGACLICGRQVLSYGVPPATPPDPQPVSGVDVAAIQASALIVKDSSITALRDEAREFGRMPFKVRDMHVMALHNSFRDLFAALDHQQREIARVTAELKRERYPHMCRDEHLQIGHSDSEHEGCPLCRMTWDRDHLQTEVNRLTQALAEARAWIQQARDDGWSGMP